MLLKFFATHQLQTQNVPQRQAVTCEQFQLDYDESFHFSKAGGGLFFLFISGVLKHFNPHRLCESTLEIRMRGERESRGSRVPKPY